jgi:hypothetical protein
MKLNDAARELIGEGTDATLVTINPDGSPQATVVWMALESTPDGDELVAAHLAEYQKTRNIRRDPALPAAECARRIADPRPDREGRRIRSGGVLTPNRL